MFRSGSGTTGVSRRSVLFGGGAALAAGVLARAGMNGALAQEATPTTTDGTPEVEAKTLREKLQEYGYLWSAASPATHQGDVYTLTSTNPGTTPVKLWVFTILVDRRHAHREVVVKEEFELAAGESRVLTATNGYGSANLFSTQIVTDAAATAALHVTVTLTDASGQETASFNEQAFLIESFADLKQLRQDRRQARRERRRGRLKNALGGGTEDEMETTTDVTATPAG
jgi:hypothetical protein